MSSSREFPARPIVGIGVAVLRGASVLMVRRGRPPAQGSWSLPGGAQKLGETAEQAARRELAEETGLQVETLYLAGCVDSIHTDPDGRIRYHYTILDFCARYAGGEARPGGDAAEVAWLDQGRLEQLGIWSEAIRIIKASQEILARPAKSRIEEHHAPKEMTGGVGGPSRSPHSSPAR
jgi:ADP-ribose pyrophosphatase YjhB (NUDIX family)